METIDEDAAEQLARGYYNHGQFIEERDPDSGRGFVIWLMVFLGIVAVGSIALVVLRVVH